ncbi:GYD domain-containing protein [Streptomyces sp. Je 1-4]|uniref:GYD domain-containing protein n=1 Tax=Streptomyces TaxID=1883 RepID=UPI00140EF8CC|nr:MULTISPECIES: GYD domain-containing protein [unclassified Streptomyces]QIK10482.1 GYD domain-containing protein [Streptomyces sp. ID38640]UYB44264.1 GYD domain-containing protein [Streptomyces sp. Je 1-4]UZQ40713.1 GYD domain-containing protein [Streptomyces sp. Je 1-4] [Streptomyces sp. Je 1-4 4N24]UZQ48130.1 GYD domain-containing protein [Streptomyces sp. Je 1-4] [Streptomyces sp. Je 1-4 4N24_ara]
MPKYLVQASYTAEGMKGLLAEGGTGRKAAVEQVVNSCGGRLETMYFAYGDDDLYCVVDFPDQLSMAAIAMTVRASGALRSKTIPLLTVEDIDEAAKKSVGFRPPGA